MNIEIDTETVQKLQAVAAVKNVTVSELMRLYADEQERYQAELVEDMRCFEVVKNGGGVTHKDDLTHFAHLRAEARARL